MAKAKKKSDRLVRTEPGLPAEAASVAAADEMMDQTDLEGDEVVTTTRLPLRSYLQINAVFFGVCILQLVLVRVVLGEQKGLFFFFGLLMASFLLVSVFDYVYDRKIDPAPDPAGE